ncbi:hypothetical protein [Vibrio sp. VB16]|nr:hypothetical protein [Vibrio sp. VB16]UGA55293.1 hypothetical protein IUZ65_002775 [Vibrio sp. VB16]
MPYAIPFLIGASGLGLGYGAYSATQKVMTWVIALACLYFAYKFIV